MKFSPRFCERSTTFVNLYERKQLVNQPAAAIRATERGLFVTKIKVRQIHVALRENVYG